MATKKQAPIDIIDAALAVKGGKPQDIELDGITLAIRRDFTGAEAQAYIGLWNPDAPLPVDKLVQESINLLSCSDDETKEKFSTRLLDEAVSTISRVLVKIGMIAGLRDGDGRFFPGHIS